MIHILIQQEKFDQCEAEYDQKKIKDIVNSPDFIGNLLYGLGSVQDRYYCITMVACSNAKDQYNTVEDSFLKQIKFCWKHGMKTNPFYMKGNTRIYLYDMAVDTSSKRVMEEIKNRDPTVEYNPNCTTDIYKALVNCMMIDYRF